MGNKRFAEQTFEYINSKFPLVAEHITFRAERIPDDDEMLGYTHVETWENNEQFTLEIVVDYRVSKNTLIDTIIHEYGHALEFIYLRATPDDPRLFTDHGALWGICQAKAYRTYWNIPDSPRPEHQTPNMIELPEEVRDWAGLDSVDPRVPSPGNPVYMDLLSSLNDEGSSFEEIADIIEKTYNQQTNTNEHPS